MGDLEERFCVRVCVIGVIMFTITGCFSWLCNCAADLCSGSSQQCWSEGFRDGVWYHQNNFSICTGYPGVSRWCITQDSSSVWKNYHTLILLLVWLSRLTVYTSAWRSLKVLALNPLTDLYLYSPSVLCRVFLDVTMSVSFLSHSIPPVTSNTNVYQDRTDGGE